MTRFTTREVAEILELPAARIRACVRAGLVHPRRGPSDRLEFDFEDLLLLRTTKDLLDARVPIARIRRILASLRRQLPDDTHLQPVTIYADGRRVVAWDGTARWRPDSGQFLFNFDAKDVVERADVPGVRAPAPPVPIRSADAWFDLGLELEGYSPDEARQAYLQALELDPTMADAHINVGRLDHEARRFDDAEAHYRAAAERSPQDPVPHFNLGVLFDDRGRRDDAIRAYTKALELDPDFADAHYNLGLIYEVLGRRTETITHLRRARTLYGRPGRA
ncbi:MAG: tetratricopeptide repeat protein [Armatimonadota bacterium]|nr:tetratricopeptide repeat protein [Armatimonadota bacterium]